MSILFNVVHLVPPNINFSRYKYNLFIFFHYKIPVLIRTSNFIDYFYTFMNAVFRISLTRLYVRYLMLMTYQKQSCFLKYRKIKRSNFITRG